MLWFLVYLFWSILKQNLCLKKYYCFRLFELFVVKNTSPSEYEGLVFVFMKVALILLRTFDLSWCFCKKMLFLLVYKNYIFITCCEPSRSASGLFHHSQDTHIVSHPSTSFLTRRQWITSFLLFGTTMITHFLFFTNKFYRQNIVSIVWISNKYL